MTHECVKTLESLLESADGSASTSPPPSSPSGMASASHATPPAATRSRSSWATKGQSTLPVVSARVRAAKLGGGHSTLSSLYLRGWDEESATRSPRSLRSPRAPHGASLVWRLGRGGFRRGPGRTVSAPPFPPSPHPRDHRAAQSRPEPPRAAQSRPEPPRRAPRRRRRGEAGLCQEGGGRAACDLLVPPCQDCSAHCPRARWGRTPRAGRAYSARARPPAAGSLARPAVTSPAGGSDGGSRLARHRRPRPPPRPFPLPGTEQAGGAAPLLAPLAAPLPAALPGWEG